MRSRARRFTHALLLACVLVTWVVWGPGVSPARADIGDLEADALVGHISFSDSIPHVVGPATFSNPKGVAIDRSTTPNRLYVADSQYSRVLGWSDVDALVSGQPADLVIG